MGSMIALSCSLFVGAVVASRSVTSISCTVWRFDVSICTFSRMGISMIMLLLLVVHPLDLICRFLLVLA